MNDLNEDITAWKIRVTGRVQGVGFRYSTLQKASRLRLTGWVRNERDGSVGIYCEGLKSRTDALLDWLDKGGPSYSRIDRVEKTPARPQGTYSRFSVEY